MTVVVNDTNVFIDLFNIGLLDDFFSLSWEVHTTNFVMMELLREGQKDAVEKFADNGVLHIPVLDAKAMMEIGNMMITAGVSLTDCSVWYYAKTNNYILLTGDRKLRKSSLMEGVEVHGIIYVIDKLVEEGVLSKSKAAERLKVLGKLNPRLPKEAINDRIKMWGTLKRERRSPMMK